MTRIEVEATIAASPADVWAALLDHERWPSWTAPTSLESAGKRSRQSRITLDALEPLDDAAECVGALRRGAATIAVPLLGARAVSWVEQVTDVAAPWTVELEALDRGPLRHWRLRLWLMEQLDGTTRVRCRLGYAPASLVAKLADALFLRRALARHAQATLDGLAQSFVPAPVLVEALEAMEAVEAVELEDPAGAAEQTRELVAA